MKAGDHIRIMKASGWEHAVDVGDRTVIHFVKGEGAKRSYLYDLATPGARVEVVTHAERVYPAKHVVARAFSRVGDAAFALAFADAESFASWCATGRVPPSAPLLLPPPRAPAAAPPSSRRLKAAPAKASARKKKESKPVRPAARRAKASVRKPARAAGKKAPQRAAAKAKRPRRSISRSGKAVTAKKRAASRRRRR
ncbi:MAG TPA: lecithin retinol acyltransferase family protein [Anaeromyxobacteraceae bacterium]|nr:lecithin retinol acyltransferase family protein [Anaeromyxobacteraceae bacterium]